MTIISLGCLSPNTSCSLPFLGIAAGGVYLVPVLQRVRGSSYLPISPLPPPALCAWRVGGIISVALFRGEGFGEQTPRVVCSVPKRLTTPSPCGGQALPATHIPGRAVRSLIGLTLSVKKELVALTDFLASGHRNAARTFLSVLTLFVWTERSSAHPCMCNGTLFVHPCQGLTGGAMRRRVALVPIRGSFEQECICALRSFHCLPPLRCYCSPRIPYLAIPPPVGATAGHRTPIRGTARATDSSTTMDGATDTATAMVTARRCTNRPIRTVRRPISQAPRIRTVRIPPTLRTGTPPAAPTSIRSRITDIRACGTEEAATSR